MNSQNKKTCSPYPSKSKRVQSQQQFNSSLLATLQALENDSKNPIFRQELINNRLTVV